MRSWREAACPAALNGLAAARENLGSLDEVTRVVRLGLCVAVGQHEAALKGR